MFTENYDVPAKVELDRLPRITPKMFPRGENIGNFVFGDGSIVEYEATILENNKRIDFVYNLENDEKFNQFVGLVSTECNFGGEKLWFSCPGNPRGYCCRRRVRTLYFFNGIFGCRDCHNLTYGLRKVKYGSIQQIFASYGRKFEQIKTLDASIKKKTYKGKRTRKFSRLGFLITEYQALELKVNAYVEQKLASSRKED